jgi:phospholipase/lecithinase/hemolysin
MTSIRFKLAAFGVAVVLAACGGGDSGPAYDSVVSFGDSLSDVGTYKVGTIAAIGGGEWTVNGPTAMNWTEVVAADDGLAAPCPAQTGVLPNVAGFQGAPVTDHPECTNYSQGSARVSNPFGSPAAVALQAAPFSQQNIGLLATPVSTQMGRHLARAGGAYGGSELVTVTVGGNDLFMNLYGVVSAAAGGATAVATAAAAGWDSSVQAAVSAGGPAAAQAATTAAVTSMGQAGAGLAALVKGQVLGKGARYVAVFNLPDVSQTPFGLTLDAASRQLVSTMVTTFNSQLQAGLSGTPALLVDAYARSQDWTANPAKYGIANVTTPACSTTSPANPLQGSSLGCSSASTIAADTSGYFYADDVHPTPLGYRLMARLAQEQMSAAAWR